MGTSVSRILRKVPLLALVIAPTTSPLDLPGPVRKGPDADFPPFVTERNGVFSTPWGASNYQWPQKMFWEHIPEVDQKLSDMLSGAAGIESEGRAPLMGAVAWGFEYTAAIGGDSTRGWLDMSRVPGWQQWGEWVRDRKDKYVSRNYNGEDNFPHAGYITPLMPLDSADWPPGIPEATYGDWAGWKLGTLANKIHARGFFAADFIVGLYGSHVDFHDRVIDDFSKWSGYDIPPGETFQRRQAMLGEAWPKWHDFKCHRYGRFYARAAETIRQSGREPLVGGQMLPGVAIARHLGNDFRIYQRHLPAKNWYFQIELQSDGDRPVPPYWSAATNLGTHAGRAPDFPFGAHMDADQEEFWTSVRNSQRKDETWGRRYLRHAWLSVGWTHVAKTDGSVTRAARAFQRGYWDGGAVDTLVVNLVRSHIPRHPFGPAFYYSTDMEAQCERVLDAGFAYLYEPHILSIRNAGVPAGYFVSDSSLPNLDSANYPSGWFFDVQAGDGRARLSAQERQKLTRIAPIILPSQVADSCPLFFQGDSIGGYGFIDQDGRVVVVVSNASEKDVRGAVRFARIDSNGTYRVEDLLTKEESALVIAESKGSIPLEIAARDTRVFAIDGLRERGKRRLIPWTGAEYRPPPPAARKNASPSVLRPEGSRMDAMGRRSAEGPGVIWNAPVPR